MERDGVTLCSVHPLITETNNNSIHTRIYTCGKFHDTTQLFGINNSMKSSSEKQQTIVLQKSKANQQSPCHGVYANGKFELQWGTWTQHKSHLMGSAVLIYKETVLTARLLELTFWIAHDYRADSRSRWPRDTRLISERQYQYESYKSFMG